MNISNFNFKPVFMILLLSISIVSAQTYTLISQNKPVTASTQESEVLNPSKALDGDLNTRWSSAFADNQWIVVDLESPQPIEKLVLNWEDAYASTYRVYVSNDGINWGNAIIENLQGDGGIDAFELYLGAARYLKLECINRASNYGFSLYEIEVYSQSRTDVKWIGELSGFPPIAVEGDAFYNTLLTESYIYHEGVWDIFAIGSKGDKGDTGAQGIAGINGVNGVHGTNGINGINGTSGSNGVDGSDGVDGESMVWLGSFTSLPSSPVNLNAFYWQGVGISCIYDGTQWNILSRDGGVTLTECNDGTGSFVDARDGQQYDWTIIGNQKWMAENLNYNSGAGSYCAHNDPAYCTTLGRLYTWTAVMQGASSSNANPSGVQGVCPAAWHAPSLAEWQELDTYVNANMTASNDGISLKATSGWLNNGIDEFNFSGIPAGWRNPNGSYAGTIAYGEFSSSTAKDGSNAYGAQLANSHDALLVGGWSVNDFANSLRCVKD